MKNQKGITLIALIITILVMLILAAVTINLVIDEDGILSRAQNATSKMSMAEVKEKAELVALGLKTDVQTGNYTAKNFKNEYFDRMQEEFGEENCKCNGSEVEIKTSDGKVYITTNDNLDVTIFNEEDKKIYCEEVASIFTDMFGGIISEEQAMQKLKEKNSVNFMMDAYYDEMTEEETLYIYVFDINALYQILVTDEGMTLEYVEKEDKLEKYEFLEDVTVGKNELEKFLIGMSVLELLESSNNDIIGEEVIQDIKNKSEKIINIDKFTTTVSNGIVRLYINNVTVLNGERETTFGDDIGYAIELVGEEGIITKIIIDYGT